MQGVRGGFEFHCYGCGATRPPGGVEGIACPACGGPLSLQSTASVSRTHLESPPRDMWHYAGLLPGAAPEHIVSLGEGATPLLAAPRLSARLGREILLKNEAANPTASFKDRQVSAGVSHARAKGADAVAVVSSGNVACAAAAYAARAGMRAIAFMHAHAAPQKAALCAVYGAEVLRVDSTQPSAVFGLCREICAARGWHHLSTAGMYEPWNVEGAKTIAYELYQQCAGELPDWIVMPVGGGGLLGGVWRGLLDLQRLGCIARLPRLAGVQAEGCAPLRQAIENGWSFAEHLAHPWPDPDTIAGGIADDILFDGHTALPAIRETGGAALAVSDGAIRRAMHELAREEGLFCEPSCAVTIAALEQLPETRENARICCILTGAGFKDSGGIADAPPLAPRIRPCLEEVDRALAAGERSR